jgi:LDH2 family malate/lactate/ureidoglycolate dehydrogenase
MPRALSTAPAPGAAAIRISGERAFHSRKLLRAQGIKVDRLVYDALAAYHRSKAAPAAAT